MKTACKTHTHGGADEFQGLPAVVSPFSVGGPGRKTQRRMEGKKVGSK